MTDIVRRKKILLKIIILGDSGAGKTALLERYVKQRFTEQYKATIGADFLTREIEIGGVHWELSKAQCYAFLMGGHKRVGEKSLVRMLPKEIRRMICSYKRKYESGVNTGRLPRCTLQLWDTAGMERFSGLGQSFYRGSDGFIFVCDLSRKKSLENITGWKEEMQRMGQQSTPMILLGNKDDLKEKEVTEEELQKAAKELGMKCCFVVSAKTGKKVDKAFNEMAELAYGEQDTSICGLPVIDLSPPEVERRPGICC